MHNLERVAEEDIHVQSEVGFTGLFDYFFSVVA